MQSYNRKIPYILFLCLAAVFLPCWLSPLFAAEIPISSFSSYFQNGAYILETGGTIVRSKNSTKKFIPASTIKVLTGLMALDILGPQYRFATRLYLDSQNNLYIRGEGDPLITSETVVKIAQELKFRGVTQINRIILDDSLFQVYGPPPGSANTTNPYDAHSSALAVNFNAVPFVVIQKGKITSGEDQTPLLPIMEEIAQGFRKGQYRVNVSAFSENKELSNTLRYTGELFEAIFHSQGIHSDQSFTSGITPRDAKPVILYESEKTVSEIVNLCLLYSSNFIANQLYLSCGSRVFGFPASWQKAKKMMIKYIGLRLNLQESDITMVDGSGLSRENRISAKTMHTILLKFRPHASLLKKRNGILFKSGTLTGVYSYVGFFHTDQNLSPFVLFLNQNRNTRKKLLYLMQNELHLLQRE